MQDQASTSSSAETEAGLPVRLRNAAMVRRLTACQTANQVLDLFLQEQDSGNGASSSEGLSEVRKPYTIKMTAS